MVSQILENQMDKLEDLLPGIEDFLVTVLANENLSPQAEEKRQFFLERLDIIKLPPSLPPRVQKPTLDFGISLSPVKDSSAVLSQKSNSKHDSIPELEEEDFAAYQREISRCLASSADETNLAIDKVKVYDDIDNTANSSKNVEETEEEESMYEIPVLKNTSGDSGYEKTIDISHASNTSSEDLPNSPILPKTKPPPLPPRRERVASDATSRGSGNSVSDEKSPDVSTTQQYLSLGTELSSATEKSLTDRQDNHSEKSGHTDDLSDDCELNSCESLDEDEHDPEMLNKLGIKLPLPINKRNQKARRKQTQSLNSILGEITLPFHSLESISLSGEMYHKSKLAWTKRVVALSNGRLFAYKADRYDSRPVLVIVLNDYTATFLKKDNGKHYEIRLSHPELDSHFFHVDFKDWAEQWCQHINAMSQGKTPVGTYQHLARGAIMNEDGTYIIRKSGLFSSTSNISSASCDTLNIEPGSAKSNKKDEKGIRANRMGSFALRASQFFDTISKKTYKKTDPVDVNSKSGGNVRSNSSSDNVLPIQKPLLTDLLIKKPSLTNFPVLKPLQTNTPTNPAAPVVTVTESSKAKSAKLQGFLNIYSSFNKRKWGKRWCLVHDNSFECYRNESSEVCELDFLLRNCHLRRAVEETKSELGLMLKENNREKITIEPMCWDELGAWLRILMKETSTPSVPEGLEGYMVHDKHYDDIDDLDIDISRLSDPFTYSSIDDELQVSSSTADETVVSQSSEDISQSEGTEKGNSWQGNRDSGNCSGDSLDRNSRSLEMEAKESKLSHHIHLSSEIDKDVIDEEEDKVMLAERKDESLTRVSVGNAGDIYTQVQRRTSGTSIGGDNSIPLIEVTKKNSKNTSSTSRENSERSAHAKFGSMINKVSDFEDFNMDDSGGNSFADELLTHFNNRLSSCSVGNSSDIDVDVTNLQDSAFVDESSLLTDSADSNFKTKCISLAHNIANPMEAEIMSDKNSNLSVSIADELTDSENMCSTCSDDMQKSISSEISKDVRKGNGDTVVMAVTRSRRESIPVVKSLKVACDIDDDVPIANKIQELRKKLVDFKKERILIRDRKQQTKSLKNCDFLDAEYERLSRECAKISEEINYLEELQSQEGNGDSVESDRNLQCVSAMDSSKTDDSSEQNSKSPESSSSHVKSEETYCQNTHEANCFSAPSTCESQKETIDFSHKNSCTDSVRSEVDLLDPANDIIIDQISEAAKSKSKSSKLLQKNICTETASKDMDSLQSQTETPKSSTELIAKESTELTAKESTKETHSERDFELVNSTNVKDKIESDSDSEIDV
ncbi:hypothetical protein CHS0354_030373 [Potamilus streckersoni]|uniref:PH domain-containing protein n=1 Tax=Potamilus streckersoni TaxID=2493646 RepID=A0AAE0T524_9BIVA|nr:hypothetical protein CHS0354_030373 [Potamilus streckersoni]